MWEFSGSIQLPNNSKLCRILKQWILNFVSLFDSLSNLSVILFFVFSVSSFQFFVFCLFQNWTASTKPKQTAVGFGLRHQLNRYELLHGLVCAIIKFFQGNFVRNWMKRQNVKTSSHFDKRWVQIFFRPLLWKFLLILTKWFFAWII